MRSRCSNNHRCKSLSRRMSTWLQSWRRKTMNPLIKAAIEQGRLVLLLGAGASGACKDRGGQALMDGNALAQHLAGEAGLAYAGEALPVVYAASRRVLGTRADRLLEAAFKHTRPSREYEALARYPWARVYTLNVDDAFEQALRRNSKQHVNVRFRFDRIVDRSPFFDELDLIKLNGSVDRLAEGLIFSPQEYGVASAAAPLWYEDRKSVV